MSYENMPKNLTNLAVLTRGGAPDYITTSVAAAPVPTAAEAGAIWEHSDTGDRFRWSSTAWIHVGIAGATLVDTFHQENLFINKQFAGVEVTSTTLAIAASALDRVINVVSATGITAGVTLQINGGTSEPVFFTVISVATLAVTLDRQIDVAHAIGTTVAVAPIDMDVVGSAGTPVVFSIGPPSGEVWHITRFLIAMAHSSAGDLGLFGDIAALTNGVVVRTYLNSVYRTLTNWKTNADMSSDMYDVSFDTRSGGGGSYGTSGRWSIDRTAAAIALDGTNGDKIQVVIQDDVSSLDFFRIKAQGHVS